MNFKRFAVGTTNIFPIANSTAGGQLLTEYNLRSRESVGTHQSVKYMIGPSYTHSDDDFYVRIQQSDDGVTISSSTIEILPGRAIVNGHFIESLSPILIDLTAANASKAKNEPALKGELSIGLKVMYSTKSTIAGSMLVENSDDMYEGIQVVILPSNEFLLPESNEVTQTDESTVTAHLKLADFIYLNGRIVNINQNTNKTKSISGDRIGDVDKLLSDIYVTKTGLNTKMHHYVFSRKSVKGKIADTWCKADDALMVWDNDPTLHTGVVETEDTGYYKGSELWYSNTRSVRPFFNIDLNTGRMFLQIPHKQVDGLVDSNGKDLYYPDVCLNLPLAEYGSESSGTVDANYTRHIKQIRSELNNIYSTVRGKQVGYIDLLTDRSKLPELNPNWAIGDYILVGNDNTIYSDTVTASGVTTSTMYFVLPGTVTSIKYSKSVPSSDGMCIDYTESAEKPNTDDSSEYQKYWALKTSTFPMRGTPGVDYFKYIWTKPDGSSQSYYYLVATAEPRQYSNPIYLTGQVMLADTERVGGFYNVSESNRDAGYVYLDETGHLRLVDYTLLRSGTLAYQLMESWDSGTGLNLSGIQEGLNDKVNNRIAFYTDHSEANAVIDIYIRLPDSLDDDEIKYITLNNIDSRFGTAVYLHVSGKPKANIEINIVNCQKIRIDNSIPDNVSFNIQNCCLYYDAEVLNNAKCQSLTLWYARYESSQPDLIIDGMTVRCADSPSITNEISYWDESNPNDLHYRYALNGVTFSNDGSIVGLSMIVQNDSTDNIVLGSRLIVDKEFKLSQSNELQYPMKQLKHKLKLSGQFVTAYPTTDKSGKGYIIYDNSVTAVTNVPDTSEDVYNITGVLSIYVKSEFVRNVIGINVGDNVNGLLSTDYHTISGGIVL